MRAFMLHRLRQGKNICCALYGICCTTKTLLVHVDFFAIILLRFLILKRFHPMACRLFLYVLPAFFRVFLKGQEHQFGGSQFKCSIFLTLIIDCPQKKPASIDRIFENVSPALVLSRHWFFYNEIL